MFVVQFFDVLPPVNVFLSLLFRKWRNYTSHYVKLLQIEGLFYS